MGTTYLELTNRVLRRLNEVEIAQANFGNVLGVQAAAKDAVLDAVRKINSQKFEWPFNYAEGSQLLTVGQEEYSWPADLRVADWSSFYIERSTPLSINTKRLKPITKDEWYEKFRSDDLDSTTTGLRIPDYAFETFSGGFGVTPSPERAYTVKFRYWIKTITLSAYSDTCTIPTEYDDVITDGAMYNMYMFMDNDERSAKVERDFKEGLNYMTYLLIPKDIQFRDTRVPNAR